MRAFAAALAIVVACRVLSPVLAEDTTLPKPLARAHAHNDYEHARPLLDALDRGFCSVEADIYLVDGKLLVAHNRRDVKPERTLEALYLDPLLAKVKANGGRVYRNGPPFTLLVDIKANGEATYAELAKTLARYAEMLTVVRDGKLRAGAVTVVISGDRPREKVVADAVRYVGIDGRMSDLDDKQSSNLSSDLMPLVSDSWYTHFKWRGKGKMPDDERQKLRAFVDKAHTKNLRVRFWATPETVKLWRELDAAGVDLINTDDLEGLARYLNKNP